MVHLSKGRGERETPCPEGGERNDKLPNDTDDEEGWEQQSHELVGQTGHQFRNRQPRGGVCRVERPGGDVAVAHL